MISDKLTYGRNPTTPEFHAPLRKGGVICVGRGVSRPTAAKYKIDDPTAEVWSINQERIPEAVRHFQIHEEETLTPLYQKLVDCSDIDTEKVRLYTPENFPFEAIRRKWLNSTPDYMLAIADMEGFSRIYMPGLDFGGIREPLQALSALYWIGVLEGKGAKVFLSPLSRVFECKIYGRVSG